MIMKYTMTFKPYGEVDYTFENGIVLNIKDDSAMLIFPNGKELPVRFRGDILYMAWMGTIKRPEDVPPTYRLEPIHVPSLKDDDMEAERKKVVKALRDQFRTKDWERIVLGA